MFKSLRNSGFGAMLAALAATSPAAMPETLGYNFQPPRHGAKGHGWGGKRRKLKKYKQDHQRPRRRRN